MKFIGSFIILISLFLPITSSGIYQYYFYDETKIKIPDPTFKRYVITQLRSINAEYYHIIKKLNPKMAPVIEIKNDLIKLKSKWFSFYNQCTEVESSCDQKLLNIFNISKNLDFKIFKFKENHVILSQEKNDIDNWLQIISFTNQISNLNYKHLHQLEEILIISNKQYNSHSINSLNLYEQSHKMLLLVNMLFTSSLDEKFKIHFDDFQTSFISDIENSIIENLDQDFFIKRLGHFNLSWNSFHMKLSKGTIKLPGKTRQTLGVMHNRWNSILKLFLKRTAFVSSKNVPKATVKEYPMNNWRYKRSKLKEKKVVPTKLKTVTDSTANTTTTSATTTLKTSLTIDLKIKEKVNSADLNILPAKNEVKTESVGTSLIK